MKRRDFLKKIGVGTAAFAVARADFALPADNWPAGLFDGTMVLGRPTDCCITISILSNDRLEAYFEYGTQSGVYTDQTATSTIEPAVPFEDVIAYLQPNTRYYHRMRFRGPGGGEFKEGREYTFHTRRAPGSTFTFDIQGDSHPERRNAFDPDLYTRTLLAAASDQPDFYILMGDDFSVDTLNADTISADVVTQRYTLQRPYLGLIANSAPLFLVNGNHEQAAGYLLDGTANNVAVWAQNARNRYYPQTGPRLFLHRQQRTRGIHRLAQKLLRLDLGRCTVCYHRPLLAFARCRG